MAVLIEGISVVIKTAILTERYPGGWENFREDVPNLTLCADSELARVGFMAPADTRNYIEHLEQCGLRHLVNGKAEDLVVVDQRNGLCSPCNWVEIGRIGLDGDPNKPIQACRLVGSTLQEIVTPDGWTFDHSLSKDFRFLEPGRTTEYMDRLPDENGTEVYRDLKTGEKFYLGRTYPRRT